jgi:glycosyltransferase involved in cell wall biosynthesis
MKILLMHPNDGTDIRVSKTCRSLSRLGFEVYFVGWDRQPGVEREIDCGSARLLIMRHATKYRRNTLLGFLLYCIHVLLNLITVRPHAVVCINEEPACLVLPLRGILYRSLVCELYDGVVERYGNKKSRFAPLLVRYGNFIRRSADKIIVTDERRFELLGPVRSKAVIVSNFPEDPGDDVTTIVPKGNTKIYVSGSLSLSRGLKEILDCVDRLDNVEIVSAGWLYDSFATDTFVKHPKVTYMGIVSGIESLRLAAQCDAIFSFYAPTSVNNIYASPNKIYDALSVGRPVIINSEVIVSKWVVENEYGWSCPYDDVSSLSLILHKIKEGRSGLPEFVDRARSDFSSKYSWQQMETVLASLYNNL